MKITQSINVDTDGDGGVTFALSAKAGSSKLDINATIAEADPSDLLGLVPDDFKASVAAKVASLTSKQE